jgi:hypothetical protein
MRLKYLLKMNGHRTVQGYYSKIKNCFAGFRTPMLKSLPDVSFIGMIYNYLIVL